MAIGKNLSLLRIAVLFLMSILIIAPAFSSVGATYAQSSTVGQIFNRQDLFAPQRFCPPYEKFLHFEPYKNSQNCRLLENFLLRNAHLSDADFLAAYSEVVSPTSTTGTLVALAQAFMQNDLMNIFNLSGLAGGRAAGMLANSLDIERAALYGSLSFELGSQAAILFCSAEFECGGVVSPFNPSRDFGSEFIELEVSEPNRVLICLLRMDAYVIPIRDLLSSARFRACINSV